MHNTILHMHLVKVDIHCYIKDNTAFVVIFVCRRDSFRKTMRRIVKVRSLIPSSVHMMCLTATATKSLREEVMTILGMRNPEVIAVSPSKPLGSTAGAKLSKPFSF